MYSAYSHLLITSSTGTYLSTCMGFGAGYQLVKGRFLFCRPDKFKDELGFHERLGKIFSIKIITQEERTAQ
jgi:hypothetical protein